MNDFTKMRVRFNKNCFRYFLIIAILLFTFDVYAQPTVLGTQLVNGSYATYNLATRGGGVRFVRLQATSAAASGTRNWEFATGTAASANYSTNWRPYITGQVLSAYDTYINPGTAASSARYNTSFGGQSGLLPAVASGSYYTVLVGGNSTANNFMSVLATTYNPVDVVSATQSPLTSAVSVGVPVTVTVTTSASVNSGEFVYIRYSNDGFATSTIAPVSMSGSTGTVVIPGAVNTIGATVSYYIFTSNQSTAPTTTQADYFTLNLFTASGQNVSGGGTNFTYTVTGSSNPQYTWNQTGTASYATASNWTPSRTLPGVFDILNFNNAATTTVTNVPTTENIGGLLITNNTSVTFATTTAATMTISNGVSGADLSVASGSQLNVLSAAVQNITLATGATGSVSGSMDFNGNGVSTSHQFIITDTGALTFNSGSTITQNLNCTGSLFGTSVVTDNNVIFTNGSTFLQIAGGNPFGSTQPNTKVVFQTGSLYKTTINTVPSMTGRTYANFEYAASGGAASPVGASAGFTIDNFIVSAGTLNVNLTATSAIKGNISVASGATLTFSPASATTINLNGTGVQTITNNGTLSIGANANLVVASGTTVDMGTSVITGAGTFTTASGATFRTANTDGISASGATGSVQTTTRTFNSGGNFVYNGVANQITGSGLPASINTLTINNSGGSGNNTVTLTGITSITSTSNSLRLQAGKLDLNNKQLTIPSGGTVASTGGDFTTTAGPLYFFGSGTVSGTVNFPTVRLSGGVNFGTNSTIVTSMTLESGSFVSAAPFYATNSTLIYNTGGTYNRNVEWGSLSGQGYPYHVSIQNGTTLDLSANGGSSANRAIAGNLNLGINGAASPGSLTMGAMTSSLVVGGDIVIGGNTSGTSTLSLSTAVGGDVYLSGNWDTKTNGSYNSNSRAVFFQGAGTSTVTTITAATFDYLFANKTSGGVVNLANDMTVNNSLILNSKIVTNAFKVIIPSGNGVTANAGGWVNGNLQKNIPTGTNSRTFEVGDNTAYTPVTIAYTGATAAGNLIVKTTSGDHPNVVSSGVDDTKSVNRYYAITNSGVAGGSYNATFNFVTTDVDSGAATSNFIVRRYVNPTWFTTTVGTKTATSTQATGISGYGDFIIGEAKPLTVSTQPSNVTVCAGASTSFTSTSLSTPTPTVKWQRGIAGVYTDIDALLDGAVYSGFTSTTLAVSSTLALNGYTYQAVFTNINGSVTSNPATLTANPLSNAGILSSNQTICTGSQPANISTTGSVGSLQWQSSTDNINFTTISGQTAATLTGAAIGALTSTTYFKVIATSGVCSSAEAVMMVTVSPSSNAGTVSSNQTICLGTQPADITTTGSVGTLQWQSSTDNINFTAISGQTSATLLGSVIGNLLTTTYFRVVATSGACSASQAVVIVTVAPISNAGTLSSNQTICTGSQPANISTTGSVGSLQWQSSTDNINFTAISGQTSATLSGATIGVLTTTTYFKLVATSGPCSAAEAVVTVVVAPVSSAGTLSGNQTICSGTQPADITTTGSVGTLQWQYSTDNVNFTTISGQTAATLPGTVIGNLTTVTYFKVIATSSPCSAAEAVVTVSLTGLPSVVVTSNNNPVCAGDDAQFYLSGTANAIVTYKVDGGADLTTTLSGTGLATITVTAPAANTTVELTKVTSTTSGCFATISITSTVNVYALPTATITSSNGPLCSGDDAVFTLAGTSGAEVVYSVNGGANQTVILTGGTATLTIAAPVTQVVTLLGITNLTTSCIQTLSDTATVTVNSNNSWIGGTGNWNVATNWSCGVIPNQYTVVEISSGAVSVSADAASYSLTMTGSATLNVSSGADLTVVNALNVSGITSGSGLTIQNNANLIQNGATNSNSGTKVAIIRDSSPLFRLDYTMWSSPTTGTQTLANFSPLTAANRYYTYNETTDAYVSNNGSGAFSLAKGYLIRMPNNWIPYSSTATPASWTGTFTGKPNSGAITYTMALNNNGYNAVGNPYPSALNIANFIDYNVDNYGNIDGTIWLWRKTNDATNPVSYTTCTGAGIAPGGNPHTYLDDSLLSAGQGFIVKAVNTGATTLHFNDAMRASDNVDQFFRVTTVRNRFWLELKDAANVSYGTKLIAYLPNATYGYDTKYDGTYINDRPTALLSEVAGKQLVIQARPSFDAQDVVPLLFKTNTPGTYSIAINKLEGLFSNGQLIYLRDNLTGAVHNFSTDGAYSFTTDAGTFANRFEVLYQAVLSTTTPNFSEASVVVYHNNLGIQINTGTVLMDKVNLMDMRGRLLMAKTKVNASQLTLDTSTIANQVLLVQITAADGKTVTKKVVN